MSRPVSIDVEAARAFADAHLVPGVDRVRGEEHVRWVRGTGGPERLVVDWRDVAATAHPLARRRLGLDVDPGPAEAALAPDPVVGPLVRARPGLRVPGAVDVVETAVMAVLGQQVTLAAARTFTGRLAAAYGETVATDDGEALLFPTATALAAADPVELRAAVGVTASRARTVVALSGAVVAGLDLGPAGSRADLLAVPGVGTWTADYVDLRCRARPDAFLPGDLALRRALGGVPAREADRLSQPWRPHRAVALLHLWTEHALLPGAQRPIRPSRMTSPGAAT